MIKRIFVGLAVAIFFALVMAVLPGPVQFAILLAFALACQAEFHALAATGGIPAYRGLGAAIGTLWLTCVYASSGSGGAAACGLPAEWRTAFLFTAFFAILVRALFDKDQKRALEATAVTGFGIIYIPVMIGSFMSMARYGADGVFATTRGGVFLVFFVAMVVKFSDAGAFGFGTAFGRHKMFPRVSPKKSWEGLAGGIATGVAIGLLLGWLANRFEWGPSGVFHGSDAADEPIMGLWRTAVVSALLVIAGVFGDLFESMFKRGVGVKDSRAVLPGLGGMLDMADSLLFAAPLFCHLLRIFAHFDLLGL
ncbi:MAG: phosphatidate cytidylyltransferase [Kiritimatiellae bacterium]|nr:phosphatidate cytidylyltransferase [Kiritimatiellia bacterium]